MYIALVAGGIPGQRCSADGWHTCLVERGGREWTRK